MAVQPAISFRDATDGATVVSLLNYAQSTLGTDYLPVLQGENSVIQKFRIYNNYDRSSNVATALNVSLTVYDGEGSGSHTATKSVTNQSWLRVYETGFGENSTPPGLYTAWEGSDTAIGGSPAGSNMYYPEIGSDGSLLLSSIRAGTDQNGVGFVEFGSYVQLPESVQSLRWTFALSMTYEWVS